MATEREPGLGTRLRHLLELLDGDLQTVYEAANLAGYRPRFTPIVRALEALGPSSIKDIAAHAGITHSAASQTIAQMLKGTWATSAVGADARSRMIALGPATQRALPQLHLQWQATHQAAQGLDAELEHGLIRHLDAAIAALQAQPFRERIARHAVPVPQCTSRRR